MSKLSVKIAAGARRGIGRVSVLAPAAAGALVLIHFGTGAKWLKALLD